MAEHRLGRGGGGGSPPSNAALGPGCCLKRCGLGQQPVWDPSGLRVPSEGRRGGRDVPTPAPFGPQPGWAPIRRAQVPPQWAFRGSRVALGTPGGVAARAPGGRGGGIETCAHLAPAPSGPDVIRGRWVLPSRTRGAADAAVADIIEWRVATGVIPNDTHLPCRAIAACLVVPRGEARLLERDARIVRVPQGRRIARDSRSGCCRPHLGTLEALQEPEKAVPASRWRSPDRSEGKAKASTDRAPRAAAPRGPGAGPLRRVSGPRTAPCPAPCPPASRCCRRSRAGCSPWPRARGTACRCPAG